MITEFQKKELLKSIGSKHISKISEYFIEQKIVNRDGNFYHSNFISKVFNGNVGNPTIEDGIFAFKEYYIEKEKAEQERRNAISKA